MNQNDHIIKNMLLDLEKKFGESDIHPKWTQVIRKYTKLDGTFISKQEVIQYVRIYDVQLSSQLAQFLRLKPVRSLSGVVPVTIFTKPYACSGNCIFCPTQKNVPKSYLSDEPGIQRALVHKYEPFNQVFYRIEAMWKNYHNTEKVELIISGGTWDDYKKRYRLEYMIQLFKALNRTKLEVEHKQKGIKVRKNKVIYEQNKRVDLAEKTKSELWEILRAEQKINEKAKHRAVGISVETRPDKVTLKSIALLRRMGITKVQLGVQNLNDRILEMNNRGHGVQETYRAIRLLRLNGFKVQIHWMCNLYGATIKSDERDFARLFDDYRVKPDELKIYPCSIVKGTKLYDMWKNGEYVPYSTEQLIELMIRCKQNVPTYCRISRLFRDIPSQLIEAGNKKTNLRQMVQNDMLSRGLRCNCIRCREVRGEKFPKEDVEFKVLEYETDGSTEYFLSFVTGGGTVDTDTSIRSSSDGCDAITGEDNSNLQSNCFDGFSKAHSSQVGKSLIIGFLRLSIVNRIIENASIDSNGIEAYEENKDKLRLNVLKNVHAMIRELHVYGAVVGLDEEGEGAGQHVGLGSRLIDEAVKLVRKQCKDYGNGRRLGVIASVGTREYYRKYGFKIEETYGYGILRV